MFAWHFALKELLQEDPGNLNGTLRRARLVKHINVSLQGGHLVDSGSNAALQLHL